MDNIIDNINWRRLMHKRRPLSLQMVELQVRMDCGGCERAVRNSLKIKGVDSVDIDLEQQKVTVVGYVDRKKVLKAVRRSGKKAEFWTYPYEPGTYHPLQSDHYRDVNAYRESYNYRKHGYTNGDRQGYAYNRPDDNPVGTMFSDDNPHACTIM
ncbi:hypothetical protein KI387_019342 [Taxus chinensis]|uniref:HMA domain-containing protein n=1 Tax=Taxus chinensis TaxID=29808 RepID=A0AA38G9Z2_TAXCH|nr:hypothetical protein KI387_019342 [Taxus chinensis]